MDGENEGEVAKIRNRKRKRERYRNDNLSVTLVPPSRQHAILVCHSSSIFFPPRVPVFITVFFLLVRPGAPCIRASFFATRVPLPSIVLSSFVVLSRFLFFSHFFLIFPSLLLPVVTLSLFPPCLVLLPPTIPRLYCSATSPLLFFPSLLLFHLLQLLLSLCSSCFLSLSLSSTLSHLHFSFSLSFIERGTYTPPPPRLSISHASTTPISRHGASSQFAGDS